LARQDRQWVTSYKSSLSRFNTNHVCYSATRQMVTDPQSRIGADERIDDLLAHIETLKTQATTNQATIVSQQATISSQQDTINRLLQQKP
jgi:hypothetical protein